MGNDIKLPVAERRITLETQRASEVEAKTQLTYEIEKISNQVTSITNQIEKIEHNLKQITHSNDYYKTLITDMSRTLHQIEMEQINANLAHENYVERAQRYLDSLREFQLQEESETDDNSDDCDDGIALLETSVSVLSTEVATNERKIVKKYENLSSI